MLCSVKFCYFGHIVPNSADHFISSSFLATLQVLSFESWNSKTKRKKKKLHLYYRDLKANLLIDGASRIILMIKIMSLSLEGSPFIKQIASAPEKWKINVSVELKTFLLKTEGIDHLHSDCNFISLHAVTISESRMKTAPSHHWISVSLNC